MCFICCVEVIINKYLKIRLFRKIHKTLRGKCSQTDKNFTKLCEKIRRKSAVGCFFSSKQLLKIHCISMRNYFIFEDALNEFRDSKYDKNMTQAQTFFWIIFKISLKNIFQRTTLWACINCSCWGSKTIHMCI